MYTKLLGGSSYDVLVPSDYMIEQLLQENLLQKIDSSKLTNADLSKSFRSGNTEIF